VIDILFPIGLSSFKISVASGDPYRPIAFPVLVLNSQGQLVYGTQFGTSNHEKGTLRPWPP